MKRKEYIMHLLNELSSFVLEKEPNRMVISLHQENDGLHLCILDNTSRTDDELDDIQRSLNAGDRPELGDYYGALSGSDLVGSARLNLIGWQVKRGEASRTDSGTKIDLWLGSERFDAARFNIHKDKRGTPS